MIKEKKDLVEQILILKNLTKTTGAIHEAQLNQLRIWFQLLFEEIDPNTAQLNWSIPEDKSAPVVTYSFKMKNKKYLENKQMQALILLNSVKFLLGDHWGLKFEINGKTYAVST